MNLIFCMRARVAPDRSSMRFILSFTVFAVYVAKLSIIHYFWKKTARTWELNMSKKYRLSVMLFRRDLRTYDNTALEAAFVKSEQVLPCFIFDPRQIGEQNRYRSLPALQFMLRSLLDLQEQITASHGQLFFYTGNPIIILAELIKKYQVEAVFVNADYTPFSRERDAQIDIWCRNNTVAFESYADLLLINPETYLTKTETPYRIFTPFFKAAQKNSVARPTKQPKSFNFFQDKNTCNAQLPAHAPDLLSFNLEEQAGRTNGLKIINNLTIFKNYKKTRDYPAYKTTELSAHNKFGTVSIREVYWAIHEQLGADHALIRALYWRDFFTYIGYHFPRVFGRAYRAEFEHIPWQNNKELFEKWCSGKTGFPIVDAGMRQLNQTGFMHNRIRLITASFLVKDLRINWLWGERYFAQKLVDYDPALNNGNWQWVASTGTDAMPYFRVFNPWLQQKKYDRNCEYIKQWVPELRIFTADQIHLWYKKKTEYNGYDAPIIDHQIESAKTKAWYRQALQEKPITSSLDKPCYFT